MAYRFSKDYLHYTVGEVVDAKEFEYDFDIIEMLINGGIIQYA